MNKRIETIIARHNLPLRRNQIATQIAPTFLPKNQSYLK
jgi:hypothetical protein